MQKEDTIPEARVKDFKDDKSDRLVRLVPRTFHLIAFITFGKKIGFHHTDLHFGLCIHCL